MRQTHERRVRARATARSPTLTRNTVTIGDTDVTIDKLAEPTELQRQAFNLINTTIPTNLS
jgi:hypothetical protein